MKNKPLSAYKKKKLIEAFNDELTATQAAHRLKLDRNTVNKYFRRIRECIAGYREFTKMQLLISLMSTPGSKAQVVSKIFPLTQIHDGGVPVHIMYIGGQLLTDMDAYHTGEMQPSGIKVSDFIHLHLNGNNITPHIPEHAETDLERIAEEFHAFTTSRIKKYFGVRNEFSYLYVKEAEFVFNEKSYSQREKLLHTMTDQIFG